MLRARYGTDTSVAAREVLQEVYGYERGLAAREERLFDPFGA